MKGCFAASSLLSLRKKNRIIQMAVRDLHSTCFPCAAQLWKKEKKSNIHLITPKEDQEILIVIPETSM